jgi:hypothetical protein
VGKIGAQIVVTFWGGVLRTGEISKLENKEIEKPAGGWLCGICVEN